MKKKNTISSFMGVLRGSHRSVFSDYSLFFYFFSPPVDSGLRRDLARGQKKDVDINVIMVKFIKRCN